MSKRLSQPLPPRYDQIPEERKLGKLPLNKNDFIFNPKKSSGRYSQLPVPNNAMFSNILDQMLSLEGMIKNFYETYGPVFPKVFKWGDQTIHFAAYDHLEGIYPSVESFECPPILQCLVRDPNKVYIFTTTTGKKYIMILSTDEHNNLEPPVFPIY